MDTPLMISIAAGLAGTTAMLLLLELLMVTHAVEGDLPWALGQLVLRRERHTKVAGLVLHYGFGVSFGIIYTNLVRLAEPETAWGVVGLCLAMGLVHGVAMALGLIGLARFHPVKRFHDAPAPAAAAHGVAHLLFGLAVAGVVLAFD